MNHFQQYLVEEFAEDYQEGRLTRREALKHIAMITGSLAVGNAVLAACAPLEETPLSPEPGMTISPPGQPASPTSPAGSQATQSPTQANTAIPETGQATPSAPAAGGTVSPSDPAVQAEEVRFNGQDGAEMLAYLARPSSGGPFPVILVCHENRGLTAHIQDVTRRLAVAGYAALAVDLLSRQGGSAQVGSENIPGALGNIAPDQFAADFRSGWEYLKTQDFAQAERVGMVGFCFGGGVTWLMATRMPELLAAVPFYGPHPPIEDVPDIQAAVLAIYAGNDQRINQGIPTIEAAMIENNKTFEKVVYPGVDHAFHNDTAPRYNAEAARDAWSRTLAWFDRYVKPG